MSWFAILGFLAIVVSGALLYPMVEDWIKGLRRPSPARGRRGRGARFLVTTSRAPRNRLSQWEMVGHGLREGPARWNDRTEDHFKR